MLSKLIYITKIQKAFGPFFYFRQTHIKCQLSFGDGLGEYNNQHRHPELGSGSHELKTNHNQGKNQQIASLYPVLSTSTPLSAG